MRERGLAFSRPDFSLESIITFHAGTNGMSLAFVLQFSSQPQRYILIMPIDLVH